MTQQETLSLEEAAKLLRDGAVGIFSTDTAFAIGCRMDDEKAVARLFEIKGRESAKATPVLVSSYEMAQAYVAPISPMIKKKLLDRFWPGALTVVFPAIERKVAPLVRGGGNTLGVRMPNAHQTRTLIDLVGVPLLGTSANFSGNPPAHQLSDLDQKLVSMVDFVLPGKCEHQMVSTVVDVSIMPWKILRQGMIIL